MRYFYSFGLASIKDFCHWSGLTLSEIKHAFHEVKSELVSYDYNTKKLCLPKNDNFLINLDNKYNEVIMLRKFDPFFVSYADKKWIADNM